MGGHIGVALAYQIAGIPSIDWRDVFIWLGILGIGMAFALVAFARAMPDTLGRPETAVTEGPAPSVRELIQKLLTQARHNTTLQLAILGMALLHLIYAEIQFMQIWLASERGYSPDEASALYGKVYLFTSVPAALLGGVLADLTARHPSFNRASFVVAVIILILPLVFLFRLAEPGSTLFLTGMIASVALFTLPYGAMLAIILDQVPDDIKASTTALTMFTVNVLIIGSATYFLGLASDIFASIDVDEPMSSALLIMDTLLILSLVAYARLHSKLQAAS
jgi:sugar phosphate permease